MAYPRDTRNARPSGPCDGAGGRDGSKQLPRKAALHAGRPAGCPGGVHPGGNARPLLGVRTANAGDRPRSGTRHHPGGRPGRTHRNPGPGSRGVPGGRELRRTRRLTWRFPHRRCRRRLANRRRNPVRVLGDSGSGRRARGRGFHRDRTQAQGDPARRRYRGGRKHQHDGEPPSLTAAVPSVPGPCVRPGTAAAQPVGRCPRFPVAGNQP